jgi:hypothetical protein
MYVKNNAIFLSQKFAPPSTHIIIKERDLYRELAIMTVLDDKGVGSEANYNENKKAWSFSCSCSVYDYCSLNEPGTLAFELYLPKEICSPIKKRLVF